MKKVISGETVSYCKIRNLNRRRRVITASIWQLRRNQEKLVTELKWWILPQKNGSSGILDSGSTSHLMQDARSFIQLDTRRKHCTSLADGIQVEACGIGSGQFFAKDGDGNTSKEVYHAVPKLKCNLLSISKRLPMMIALYY